MSSEKFQSKEEDANEASNMQILQSHLERLAQFPNDYFLEKHSLSFKCLEQYLCSKSDLRLTLAFFPPLADPGIDDAFNYIVPEVQSDPTGAEKYLKRCKDLSIAPIRRVLSSLKSTTLNLKFYGLTLKQMHGIADALKVNSNVKTLILEENFMSPEASSLIGEILRENNSICYLNLQQCRIGKEGADKLCGGITSSQFLTELNLSYNSLGDKGLEYLKQGLIENTSIKVLNLSHNDLTEESAFTLQAIFTHNKILECLDLSWNGFYTGLGNKILCKGLLNNESIRWISLAWNGIGTGLAMKPICALLKKTKTMQYLDLSWNRITKAALRMLRSALIHNNTLQEIKIGHNIFTSDEAFTLANIFLKVRNSLTLCDMENMCVNKNFLQIKNRVRQRVTITHGHVLGNYKIHGPNINKLIFQRCRYVSMKPKKKKMKKDFGHFVLSLPDSSVTQAEFYEFIKQKKIKIIYKDRDLVNELLSLFQTKNKKVDCQSLKNSFLKLFPDTELPPEQRKKKKRKKTPKQIK